MKESFPPFMETWSSFGIKDWLAKPKVFAGFALRNPLSSNNLVQKIKLKTSATHSVLLTFLFSCMAFANVFAEANYVYHEATTNNPGCGANNYRSVVTPNSSQPMVLAWKIEFLSSTTQTRVYYTTDGSTPSGGFGVGGGTTQVLTGSYSCIFGSGGGPVDVATATIPARAAGTTVKYIISAWHSSGGAEIFANGGPPGCSGCGAVTLDASLATIFSYTVTPPPTITSFTPTSGAVGTTVTITGTGFNTTAANNIVYFGATKATVSAATATSLTVTVPVGATFASLSVFNTSTGLLAQSPSRFTPTYSPGKGVGFAPTDFAAAITTDLGNPFQSNGVLLGDVDGDGKADLITSNPYAKQISVVRNTSAVGSLSFATKVSFAVGASGTSPTNSAAFGDLDGDGVSDIIVCDNGSSTLSAFRNTSTSGTISLGTRQTTATLSTPVSVALADFNGDGKLDAAVANSGAGNISTFLNTSSSGTISFGTRLDISTGTTPYFGISCADFDGDGKMDIAVLNRASSTISVLRNTSSTSTISFAAKVDFTVAASNGYRLSVGDIDGDGKADLAVCYETGTTLSVFRNTSASGSISMNTRQDITTLATARNITLGDVNGDAKIDMIVGCFSGFAAMHLNTSTIGTISFAANTSVNTGAYPEAGEIGDLDGDGKFDIVQPNAGGFAIYILRNNPQYNVNLSALTISSGTLSPTFAAATTSYTTSVGGTSVTVTPTVADATSTIQVRVNGGTYAAVTSGSPSSSLALNVGANTVNILVTALDGTTTKTYTITVTRLSNNADLSALTTTAGTIAPTFAAGTTSYTASVANGTASVTVTPTKADANATIQVRVNGGTYATVTSGATSSALALNVGSNAIDVKVTAQDGTTIKTYTISVCQAPLVPTGTATQNFYGSSTVASLTATGTAIQWYAAASGGSSLPSNTPLVSGTHYYASQTVNGCESSSRLDVTATRLATTFYVMPTTVGTGDALSWANASSNLQSVITNAISGDQIWVSTGTYKPTVDPSGAANARRRTFLLKSGVKLYGGFVGTETLLSQRDFNTNVTTLSGDFNGDDAANFANNTENAYIVVMSVGCSNTTGLDGFKVTGGNANLNSSYTVSGYSVDGNSGAGMQNGGNSSFTVSNCTFTLNKSNTYAAGVYNYSSAMTYYKCLISANQCGYIGAGMFSWGQTGAANLSINNCVFLANISGGTCGGLLLRAAAGVCTNTLFINNSGNGAGLFSFGDGSTADINNCTFYGNIAPAGTNIATTVAGTSCTIRNSIFWNNTGGDREIHCVSSTINNSVFATNPNNFITLGTGNVTGDPYFVNTSNLIGADGLWGTADDGLRIGCGSSAYNAANNATAISTDIVGVIRPQLTTADAGAYESGISLINTAITINTHPQGATYCQNTTASALSISASGSGLTYQWYSNASNSNTGGTLISGAINSTYTPSTTALGTIYYYCVVNSASGCYTATPSNTAAIVTNITYIAVVNNGNWSSASTWSCNTIPPSGADVIIDATGVTLSSNVTVHSITVNTGKSITHSSNTLNVQNGFITNNGTFTSNAAVGISGTVTVSGIVSFTDVHVQGTIDFGSNSTLAGLLYIYYGGSVVNRPTYGNTSGLFYTGAGTIVVGNEWPTGNINLGSLYVSSGTVLDFGTISTSRQVGAGRGTDIYQNDGTINLSSVSGGDLILESVYLYNAGTLNTNQRTVTIQGGNSHHIQNAGSGITFYNLVFGATGSINIPLTVTNNLNLTAGCNMDINNTGSVTLESGATNTSAGSGRFNMGNSNGFVKIKNITTARTFPLARFNFASSYTPLTISNGQGLDYTVKMNSTNPSGGTLSAYTAARTFKGQWDITPSAAPASPVTLAFQYNDGDLLAGSNTQNKMLMHYVGGQWTEVTGNVATPTGTNPYTVSFAYSGTFSPFSFGGTPSTNADLSALTTTAGTIAPTFASATTAYTASVANGTASVTVMPTKADANATIQVRVNGGTYATVTSGAASSALALNVGANPIDVKVTAEDGTTIKTYTISVCRLPIASISGNNGPICSGSDATFTLTGSSGATVTYNINGGANTTATLTGGTAIITLTAPSANQTLNLVDVSHTGCANTLSGNSTVVVNNSSVVPTSISGTSTICNGSSTTLTAVGGTLGTGANYQWGTGSVAGTNPLAGETAATLSISPASTTTYWVRIENGTSPCAANTSGLMQAVTVNEPSVAVTSITGTSTICNGSATTLTAVGGTLGTGANYQWGTGSVAGTNPLAGETAATLTVSPTSTTTYWVRIENGASPCVVTTSGVTQAVTVNEPSVAPASISGTSTICNGSATTLTAVSGTLGTGANYQWGTGSVAGTNPLSGETAATLTISPTSTTTYWVRIENGTSPCAANTSELTQAVTVNNPSVAPTNISGTSTICNGSATTLTAVGGTLGTGANYQWGTGSVVGTNPLAGETAATLTVLPTSATTYWVRIENGASPCAATTSGVTQAVTVNTRPTSSIIGTQTICNGNSINLFVLLTGTAPWSLTYTDGTTPVTVTGISSSPNSFSITPSATSTYTISALSDAVCAAQAGDRTGSAVITINYPPSITTAAASNSPICAGTTLNLSVAASGTAPLTYAWAGTGTFTNGTTATPTVTGAVTGNYVATISNGCGSVSSIAAVTVNTPSVAPTSITGTNTICNGSSTTLTAAGGTLGTGANYQWGTGSTVGTDPLSGQTTATLNVSPTSTTTYWVRIENGTSPCAINTSGVTQTVTVNNPSVAPTSITGTSTICNGGSTTLTAVGGTLGTGANYQWGTGSTVGANPLAGETAATLSVSPTSTTTYWVRIENGASPCTANTSGVMQTITVSNPSVAPASITGTSAICNGGSTTLTAVGGTLGTGANYQWGVGSVAGTNPLTGETAATFTIAPTSTTTYWVRIENTATSCAANTSGLTQAVTVNARPTSTTIGTQTICNGNTANMFAILTGSAPWSLTYTDGTTPVTVTGITSSPYSFTTSPSTTTTYTVTALSDALCTSQAGDRTGSAVITVNNPSVAPSSIVGTMTICNGVSTTLIALGGTLGTGANYQWGTGSAVGASPLAGETAATLSVSPTSTTTYWVRIENTASPCAGATGGVTQTVTVNPLPTVSITANNSPVCSGTDATFTLIGTADAVVSYTLNGTAGTATLTGGTATVTATSVTSDRVLVLTSVNNPITNCSQSITGTSTVTVNTTPTVNATPASQSICPSGTITDIALTNPNSVSGTVLTWSRDNTTVLTGIASTGNGASISGSLASTTPGTFATTTFTVTATANGCSTNTTATVSVGDVIAPVANVASLSNITGECSATATAPTATDNCVGSVTATTTDPLSYSVQGTYTIHWTYNDGNGNTSTQNQTVIVDDITAPVANVASLSDITGECGATATAPTATDNCVGSVTATTSDPLSYSAQGTYTIHWTYNDGNGNTSTQNQTVIVDDVTAPVAVCSPLSVTLSNATGDYTLNAANLSTMGAGSSDNCTSAGNLSFSAMPNNFNCITLGAQAVVLTVNDGNGNDATCNTTVTVNNYVTASAGTDTTICDNASVTLTGTGIGGAGTYNYVWTPSATLTGANTSTPTATPVTNQTYTLTVTDPFGCSATNSVNVNVISAPSAPISGGNKCVFAANSNSITLGVTGTDVKWYSNATHSGTALSTSTTYTATTTGTYYAYEVAGNGCYSNPTALTATIRTNLPTAIPTSAGYHLATDKVVDNGWSHYCDCPNNELLLSLQQGAWDPGDLVNNLNPTSGQYAVRTDVGASPITNLTAAPYNADLTGWQVISRTWDVVLNNSGQEPNANGVASVGVRSYFTQAEFNAINATFTTPLSSPSKLTVYKLDSITAPTGSLYASSMAALEAGHVGIDKNHIELYNNQTPYLPDWTYIANNVAADIHTAEMSVTEFSGGGGGGGNNGGAPFPISLTKFNGYNENVSNRLFWTTESELNADRFIVERSNDNADFTVVGEVIAVGNSATVQNYSFNDRTFKAKDNFYRLKMLDKDGTFAYSKVIEITTNKLSITIYPNPAQNEVFIAGNFPANAKVSLSNMLGQEMLNMNLDATNQTAVSLQNIPQGVYMLNILNEKGVIMHTEKLVRE